MFEIRVVPGEEIVVPDAMKAAWHGVEKDASDKLCGFERQGGVVGSAFAALVLDAESDAPSIEGDDASGGSGGPVGVTRQMASTAFGAAKGSLA